MDQISSDWGHFSLVFFFLSLYDCNKTCPVFLSMSPFSVWGFRLPKEEPLVPVKQSVQSLIHPYSIIKLSFFCIHSIYVSVVHYLCYSAPCLHEYKNEKSLRNVAVKCNHIFSVVYFGFCYKQCFLPKLRSTYSPSDGSSGFHMLLCSLHVTL